MKGPCSDKECPKCSNGKKHSRVTPAWLPGASQDRAKIHAENEAIRSKREWDAVERHKDYILRLVGVRH